MPRLLCTLGVTGTMFGIFAGVTGPSAPSATSRIEIVGNVRPLFLGSATVTASALPPG